MQNSDFWTRITNLYGSQTSPVVLCMQYSVISTRNTCLYGSQPKSVVFACKTATFGEELQVSMCHSSHLWFLHTQQRILDQNFKSVRVPDFVCGFWMPNSEFWPRITSLYGSKTSPALVCNQYGVICTRISSLYWFQPSSVVLCLQNSDFRTRLKSLYGSQTSSVVLSKHNCVLSTRINRLYWFQLSPVVLCMENSVLSTWITSLYGSQPSSVVFACKTATFGPE